MNIDFMTTELLCERWVCLLVIEIEAWCLDTFSGKTVLLDCGDLEFMFSFRITYLRLSLPFKPH